MRRTSSWDLSTFSPFNLLQRWEHEVCGATSKPIADRDSVYLCCEHRFIFAFNQLASETGYLRWKKRSGNSLQNLLALVPGGVLYDPDMDHVEAIDAARGERLWKRELKAKGPRKKSFVPANFYQVKVVGSRVHVLNAHGLYTIDAATGKETRFHGAVREWNYILADEKNIYLAGRDQGVIEVITPRKYPPWPDWLYSCGAPLVVSPVMDARSIYGFSYDGHLHQIDRSTGQPLGYAELGLYPAEPPLLDGHLMYVLSDDGSIQALNLRCLAGSPLEEGTTVGPQDWRWQFQPPRGRLRSAIQMGAALFVAADDGLLYGLDAATGHVFWQHDLQVRAAASFCLGGDTLIAAVAGKVVVFAPPPGFDREASFQPRGRPQPAAETLAPRPSPRIAPAIPAVPTPAQGSLMLGEPGLPRDFQTCPLPSRPASEIAARLPHIFLGCVSGEFLAVDPTASQPRWQVQAGGGCQGRPQIGERAVFTNTDREIFAFEIETGRRIWRRSSHSPIQMDIRLYKGALIYQCEDGQIVCLDAASGRAGWEVQLDEPGNGLGCAAEGMLFVDGKRGVHARALRDGAHVWFSPTADRVTSPIVYAGSRIFFGCRDQRLYVLEANTGELDWCYRTHDEIRVPPAIASEGCVYVASLDRYLYALDGRTGERLWRFQLDQLPVGQINLTSATAYLATQIGLLYAIERAQGRLCWKHDLGGVKLQSAPLVVGGFLFAALADNRLLRVHLNEP